MATPNLVAGTDFRIHRMLAVGPPQTFTFLCIATSLNFNRGKNFEEAYLQDCASPALLPVRKSVPTGTFWDCDFSGTADLLRIAGLEADWASKTPFTYKLTLDVPLAQGGGSYTGLLHVATLNMSKSNNGLVNFTCQARGDDAYTYLAAAA